jgi:hypothetical protein
LGANNILMNMLQKPVLPARSGLVRKLGEMKTDSSASLAGLFRELYDRYRVLKQAGISCNDFLKQLL